MDRAVFRKWDSGIRVFGEKSISTGVYDVVDHVLREIANQGVQYTEPLDCESLLDQLQTRFDHGVNDLGFPAPLQPGQGPGPSSPIPGPSQPQPGPSQQPKPGPSRSRKRPSPGGDKGPGGKRKREETSPPRPAPVSRTAARLVSSPLYSDVEPTSPPLISLSPIAVRRPVKKRKMPGINNNNCVECKLRTEQERQQTARYEEPLHPTWGLKRHLFKRSGSLYAIANRKSAYGEQYCSATATVSADAEYDS